MFNSVHLMTYIDINFIYTEIIIAVIVIDVFHTEKNYNSKCKELNKHK